MTTRPAVVKFNWLLIVIILAGFALRLFGLGRQSLWYDETVSAFLAAQPPAELIAHTARDIHPPGYYLLLHFWAMLAGHTEFALAYFSTFFGILLIPLTCALAKILVNRPAATWAAFLVAISPYHLWYSQEVRMYTLGAAAGLLAAYCALQAWRNRPYFWAGYSLAAIIGLYALYYFSFLLIALNLYFLYLALHPKLDAPRLKWLLGANAITLMLYLPWLPIAWRQIINPPVPPWRSTPALGPMLAESWTALSLGQSVTPAQVWPALLLTLALSGLGLAALRPRPAIFLAAYTFGPLLLIVGLSAITPLYHARYLFTYAAGFYVLLAVGLYSLATRVHLSAAISAAAILTVAAGYAIFQFYVDPQFQADDFRAAVQFINQRRQPGDALLANAGYTYTAFAYYTDTPFQRRRLVPYALPTADQPLLLETGSVDGAANLGWGDPRADFYPMPADQTVAALEQLARDYPRLWLLRAYDTVTDPTGLIRNWLANHAIPLEDQVFTGPSNIRAQGYLLAAPPAPEQPAIPFADGMALRGWQLPGQNWRPGQTIPLKFWFAAAASPTTDYKMSLKLWTPAGQLAAQGRDEWPGGTLYRSTRWPVGRVVYHPGQISLPATLPPGQYWLNIELYHPDTLQPLPRQDDGSTVVTLGPVRVE